PVFEDGFFHALEMRQIGAAIIGNARKEDVMVATLDDVDRIDLHIAQMGNGGAGRRGPGAEWGLLIEPLRPEPDPPGRSDVEGIGFLRHVWFLSDTESNNAGRIAAVKPDYGRRRRLTARPRSGGTSRHRAARAA